ncbi:MAG: 2-oxo acid dehydrogenase subunit E2 [Alphaproteobacteria bacterium]|nr:2-oxo acid dehydrogenase subunit E2 [Alphaproteobacteria bacterium]
MKPVRLSPVRRLLLRWFDPKRGSPYVSITVTIDVSASLAWLAGLKEAGRAVSLQSLLIGAVGRLYTEFPQANRRIIGGRVYQLPAVGVAAPVNLVGHRGGDRMDTSMMLLDGVDRLSLVEIDEANRRVVRGERAGRPDNPVIRQMVGLAERAPIQAIDQAISAMNRLHNTPALARLSWKSAPVSTAVSNVGASLGDAGAGRILFRAGSICLPVRPLHVGSIFGVSYVQDEVIAVDGAPAVRPMLPIIYAFDHRLFDGHTAALILTRLAALLSDPAALFGSDGTRRPESS